jgi:hypothetical protein
VSDPTRDWVIRYLRRLPPELRTAPNDPKLVAAAKQARGNGWDPEPLAAAVARRDYTGILHAALTATQRLDELGCIPPPPRDHRPVRGGRCPVCPAWVNCEDHAQTIPAQWTRERLALLRDLSRIPLADLGEDAREQLMADLIRAQKGH